MTLLLMSFTTVFSQSLVITEINYNDPSAGNFGDSLEYVELYNSSPSAIPLGLYQFTAGITYTFSDGALIGPQEYIIIAKNAAIFQAFYGMTGQVFQWNTGQALSNNGEAIVLKDPAGIIQDTVRYYTTAPWPVTAAGTGPSMVLCDPSLDNNEGLNWAAASPANATMYGSITGLVIFGNPGAGCILTPPYTPVYATIPYLQSFDATWINGANYKDVPDNHWKNSPSSGNTSWRQDSDGLSGGWTNVNTGVYTPAGAVSTPNSARFHTGGSANGAFGMLDFYVDLSSPGAMKLDFWYLNLNGTDSLVVYFSKNAGASWMLMQKYYTTSGWEKKMIVLNNFLSGTCIVRFKATSNAGTSDIGLDEVSIAPLPALDAGVAAITAPGNTLSNLTENVSVSIKNYGAATLTSATIGWSVNGQVQPGYPWTGSLASQASSGTIDLGPFTFSAGMLNTIKVWTQDPNLGIDADPANDTATKMAIFQEYAPIPFIENFDNTWIDKYSTHDVPSVYWSGDPSTGNNSWRRDDDGATAGWGAMTTGAYTPAGASGTTNSARFHTSGCAGGSVGILHAYVDLSTPGDKELRFWHINAAGQDSLAVWMSTDGGTTYTFLAKWSVQATWAQRTVLLGNITSPTCVFRFKCTSNQNGNTDPGLDQVSISLVQPDIAVTKIVSPLNGCNLAANSDITVRLKNVGNKFGANIPVISNAGSFMYADTLFPGDSVDFVAGTITIPAGATELITVYTALSNDINALNDTIRVNVKHYLPITSFPFLEDFETGSSPYFGLITAANSRASIESGVGNQSSIGLKMAGYVAGTWPSGSGATTTAAQAFSYTDHIASAVTTCMVDATSLAAPELKIDLRQEFSAGWAYSYFRVLVNDTDVLTDNTGNSWFNPTTQSSDLFVTRTFDLVPYAGTIFKLTLQSSNKYNDANGQNGVGDNAIIDNIIIKEKLAVDAGVVSVTAPVNNCGLGMETVSIVISNPGASQLVNIPLSYSINGGTAVNEIFAGPITSGQTAVYSFTTLADLSTPGAYTLDVSVAYPGDLDPSNDDISKIVTHTPFISAFPYHQDFESANTGWYSSAVSGVDEWISGTPAKPNMNTAHSGMNVWITGLTDNYADNLNTCVYSPCFDFTSIADPILGVWLRIKSELGYDGMILESSDNGGPWTKVTGTGFYNNTSNNGPLPAPKWSGDNADWTRYSTSISQFAGLSKVQFRFRFASDYTENDEGIAIDDFSIYPATPDLTISEITSPFSGCSLSALEAVQAKVINAGPLPAFGFTMRFSVDMLPYVTEILTDTLDPGEEYVHTFNTPANLSTSGIHYVTVGVLNPDDLVNDNDSIEIMLFNTFPIANPPVTSDFEDLSFFEVLGFADYSNSRISIQNGIGLSGSHAVLMTGGSSSTWPGTSGTTTTVNQAYGYDDHLATIYTCQVFISTGAAWAVSMDARQTYNAGPKHSWMRVMMNDTEYLHELVTGDSTFNPTTPDADPFMTRLFLLDPTQSPFYLSVQSACRNDEPHAASGIGDNVIIDNLGIIIVEGISNPDAYGIILYPNPASDLLNLQFAGNVEQAVLELRSVTGQLLLTKTVDGKQLEQIDTELLPAGVYTITVKTEQAVNTMKFVKQ